MSLPAACRTGVLNPVGPHSDATYTLVSVNFPWAYGTGAAAQ